MVSSEIPIVFIHLGNAPPPYLRDAVKQARLWNPTADIVCISSVLPEAYGVGEIWIDVKNIPKGTLRKRFENTTTLDADWRGGFWRLTTERLFILEEWMRWAGVEECCHLENDIMLYRDISTILPILREITQGLSTTFQGQGSNLDTVRICFSILYCKSADAMERFLFSLASSISGLDEMHRGGQYWLDTPEDCSWLPVAPVGVKLVSETYRRWIEDSRFPCIFDAAAHGQYLGGCDPINGIQGPGFVNMDTDYRVDQFLYGWRKDLFARRYPVLMDKNGQEWPLANLHIHCKELSRFVS